MVQVSFKDIYTAVYSVLGENPSATSSTFALETAVKPLVNQIQGLICNGIMVDEFKGRTLRCGFLPFLYKQMFIQNVKPVKQTQPNTVWGTTLYANTTDFASSWYLSIEWNIVKYTGKAADHFTGVTWMELVYNNNAYINQVRAIPATATFPMDLRYLNQEIKVQYMDFRDDSARATYWQIVEDNSQNKYILINWYRDTKDQFRLDYRIKPVDMIDDDDECTLPDQRWVLTIPLIVACKLLNRDGFDMIKASVVWGEWYDNLQNFYQVQTELRRKFKQKIVTRPYDNYYSGVTPNQNIYYRAS